MRHLRDTHLIDPASDYVPDVPEVGDTVRIYESEHSEYYIIAKVIEYDDDKETYLVYYSDRGGETCSLDVSWNLVETESIVNKQENLNMPINKRT